VTAFGVTTAVSYALSGLVDWRLAVLFVIGGAAGGALGIWLGARLTERKRALSLVFSAIIITVGVYVVSAAILTSSADRSGSPAGPTHAVGIDLSQGVGLPADLTLSA